MFKNLANKIVLLGCMSLSLNSCASTVKWEGDISTHSENYMNAYTKFRKKVCVPKAEGLFEEYLKAYRGQGYWIPELEEDVDVATIESLLPEMEKKLNWIRTEKKKLLSQKKLPPSAVTSEVKNLLKRLAQLKKIEVTDNDAAKTAARQESLKVMQQLQKVFDQMVAKVSFLTNYSYPVDHLKNRKVYDEYKERKNSDATKKANYTFLYRKLLEDGAYNKDRSGPDIYLRTTLDTLYLELKNHGFYLTEAARYDLDFVLNKIESELKRGKAKLVERLEEWEQRTEKTLNFYRSLTLPENQKEIKINKVKTTRNRELIKEHNHNTQRLKDFVYTKQAEVYEHWLKQPELLRAVFVLETILLNEVGRVDGDDALERMDVVRVVLNRLDKPKYLTIGQNEFIWPHLNKLISADHLKQEKWLNALFKQGEFSFTYYYMNGVVNVFCPDMGPSAKKLRKQNVEIALRLLKEDNPSFKATRYFSRASMIGRIPMDSVWEDYSPYPERPGLLAKGQEALLKAFKQGDYNFLYSFQDPEERAFHVLEIKGENYAMGDKNGLNIFFYHRNPHFFRYFHKLTPDTP